MKLTDLKGTVKLNNGVDIPYLGLGVFESKVGEETTQAVEWALEAGYRHIDTATIYRNEDSVGRAIHQSGVPREEIFITTKLWNSDQGCNNAYDAFNRSLDKLNMDYVDLYLIHWAVSDKYTESWDVLQELYEKGRVRAIGVSNFNIHHLEDILNMKGYIPMVNQVEFHPYLVQNDLLNFCKEHGIRLEAWAPIMKGNANAVPLLVEIAGKYGVTPVQVCLRWELQKGIVVIPKSVKKERIQANAQVFNFELSEEEINKIDGLNKNHRYGPDPEFVNF